VAVDHETVERSAGDLLELAGRALRCAGLVGVPLFVYFAMAADAATDVWDPAWEGTQTYGHNGPEGLRRGVQFLLIECAVLVGLLRPWSWKRSWIRAGIALVLWSPWALLSLMSSMHAGGVWVIHGMWTLFVWCFLGTELFWSGIARLIWGSVQNLEADLASAASGDADLASQKSDLTSHPARKVEPDPR